MLPARDVKAARRQQADISDYTYTGETARSVIHQQQAAFSAVGAIYKAVKQ